MIRYAAQHLLLQGLIDYAGVFPPAALSLEQALANYRSYQEGPYASLLGRLVLKCEMLEPLRALLLPSDRLRLSLILSHPDQVEQVEAFHSQVSSAVRADTLEMRWNGQVPKWNYWLYLEVTPEDWIEAARQAGGRIGLKLRTGGLVASAFPSRETLADFLELVHARQLPYKFTAGLHHAWPGSYRLSYEPDSACAPMYGFLSLFGLACLHWSGQLGRETLLRGLAQPPDLQADDSGLNWGQFRCPPDRVEEYRARAGQSFGSCSFDEPCQDLLERRWIC